MSFRDYTLILGQNYWQCGTCEMQLHWRADKYIFKWQVDDHKILPFQEGANKELNEVRKFKPCHPISPPTPADAPLRLSKLRTSESDCLSLRIKVRNLTVG